MWVNDFSFLGELFHGVGITSTYGCCVCVFRFFWPFSLFEQQQQRVMNVLIIRSTALCLVFTFVNVQSPLSQQSNAAHESLEIHWGIYEKQAILTLSGLGST